MIRRFCLYALLRNLRFFDAFFVIFLLLELKLSYTVVGLILAYEKLILGVFEVPLAIVSDRLGRRSALICSFAICSLAFALFGLSPYASQPIWLVLLGQTVFGMAESLRTGTHKAIVLDWLSTHQRREQRVEVLGRMRFFSKSAAGLAALFAGFIVWWTGAVAPLFWAAMMPTVAVIGLLSGYPKLSEGEIHRQTKDPRRESNPALGRVLSQRQVWALIVPSVLFESQIKLTMPYLQPVLSEASKGAGLMTLGGVGALVVGGYLAMSGGLAGIASLWSKGFAKRCRSVSTALLCSHVLAAVITTVACLGFYFSQVWMSLGLMVVLSALQNIRRPIFVTAIDDVMDPHYRATVLSVESQGRSWVFAATSVLAGWCADTWGLGAAFTFMAGLLWLAVLIGNRQTRPAGV